MTYLEALYGSQYYEIQKQGKDGNKGRLNGNLFFSAFIILILMALLMMGLNFIPGFGSGAISSLGNMFGYGSGKTVGKLLAIPVLAIIYFTLSNTVGSEQNFKKHTDTFMSYPDDVKTKANAKLLWPFFIVLFFVFGMAMYK